MGKKKIIFAVIILCLVVILAVGRKRGIGNITGGIVYEKITDNETKEDTKSKETVKEQNNKKFLGKITASNASS